jgi:hypothetical protein
MERNKATQRSSRRNGQSQNGNDGSQSGSGITQIQVEEDVQEDSTPTRVLDAIAQSEQQNLAVGTSRTYTQPGNIVRKPRGLRVTYSEDQYAQYRTFWEDDTGNQFVEDLPTVCCRKCNIQQVQFPFRRGYIESPCGHRICCHCALELFASVSPLLPCK